MLKLYGATLAKHSGFGKILANFQFLRLHFTY
jgi:hypothetical protein